MLKTRKVTAVLEQAVNSNDGIDAAILLSTKGSRITSYCLSTLPSEENNDSENNGEPLVHTPDRTKLFELLAATASRKYAAVSSKAQIDWIAVRSDEGAFNLVISPVVLEVSQQTLLLVFVMDRKRDDPEEVFGTVTKQAVETAKVLSEGLREFKMFD